MNDKKSCIAAGIEELEGQIGKRLCVVRIQQGLKLQAVASLIDVSHQQISKYEKGVSRISAGTLLYLSRTMKVPIGDFFPRDGEVVRLHEMEKLEAEFIHLLRALGPVQQKLLFSFMRGRQGFTAAEQPEAEQMQMAL